MTDTINTENFFKIIKRLAFKVDTCTIQGGVGPAFLYIVYLDEDQL